jgi:hypothetical protein
VTSHRRDRDELERMLQRSRPEAPEALVESIAARVEATARRQPMLFAPLRIFALVLTLAMFGALASFGGISYAASAAHQAVSAVKRVTAPNPIVNAARTPAQLQYDGNGVSGKPPTCKKNQVRVHGKCVPKCKSNQRRVNGKCARRGGVRGATKTIISSGVEGATASISDPGVSSGSNLPFTGFDLMLVIGGGLLLVLAGGALRRFSVRRQ